MCTASILAKISVHSSDFVQKNRKTNWLATNHLQKIRFATDQSLKNGCSPTIFKNYGWPPTKISKNGCSPTNFKNYGWPPTKISKMVAHRPISKIVVGHQTNSKNLVGSQAKLKLGGLLTKRFGGFLANEFPHVIIQILIKNQAWKTTWQDGTIQPAAKLKAKSQTLNFAARNISELGLAIAVEIPKVLSLRESSSKSKCAQTDSWKLMDIGFCQNHFQHVFLFCKSVICVSSQRSQQE